MKLKKVLVKEVLLKRFCEDLEQTSVLVKPAQRLTDLLAEANEVVFKPFGIKPSDKVYFIAGSGHLYLYPQIQELMKMKPIGDLDVIIPNQDKWNNLESFLAKNPNPKVSVKDVKEHRYIPSDRYEVYDRWKPQFDEESAKDFSVRSTFEIQKDAKLINGYYFMSLYDVMDYKLNLNRSKEQALVKLLMQYQQARTSKEKQTVRGMVLQLFAGDEDEARDFLAPTMPSPSSN